MNICSGHAENESKFKFSIIKLGALLTILDLFDFFSKKYSNLHLPSLQVKVHCLVFISFAKRWYDIMFCSLNLHVLLQYNYHSFEILK